MGELFIPADFVVLEMDSVDEISLLLQRPFLATTHANINFTNGTMILTVKEKKVEFDLHGITTTPMVADDWTCFRVDM